MFEILSTCKGGGYRYCRTSPKHPKANRMGLYPLHRVLMENKLGRLLRRDEDVHHIDGDKSHDEIENLEVLTASEHTRRHNPRIPLVKVACRCGHFFDAKPHDIRRRVKQSKTGDFYCSRSCSARFTRRKQAA